jgi:hypothetical protein
MTQQQRGEFPAGSVGSMREATQPLIHHRPSLRGSERTPQRVVHVQMGMQSRLPGRWGLQGGA